MYNDKELTDNKAPIRSVAMGSSALSLGSSRICGEYSSEVRSMSTARSMHATVDGGAPSVAVDRRDITWNFITFYNFLFLKTTSYRSNLRHSVLKKLPRICQGIFLRLVEWRNSTPLLVLLPERKN